MADASPQFRQDLVATAVEADGVAYVDVRDPRTGQSFRFYDFEHALALQLNGQPIGSIVAWAAATYGLEVTPTVIAEFAQRLAELGFLAAPASPWARPGAGDFAEESQPVSQVVSRAVEQLAPPAPPFDPAQDISGWASDLDIAIDSGSGLGREGTTRDIALRETISREMTAEPASNETMMGFSARTGGREIVVGEPAAPNGETMMGFAAVSAIDFPEPPPRGALERRQPPPPESVQMAPFQEEVAAQPRRTVRVRKHSSGDGRGRSLTALMWIVVLLAAAAGVGYYLWSHQQAGGEARRVRVIAPRPAAVYRWFEPGGTVVAAELHPLSFSTAGAVGDVLPAGTRFAAGEIVAKLQGAAAREAEVNRHRSRLGYYQQLCDSMKAANNQDQLRQAERKLAEKKSLLAEAEADLARAVIRAAEPGEIVEVIARVGAPLGANRPVVRVKPLALLGEFSLQPRDAETAARLGFCRVEVMGGAPTASNAPARHGGGTSAADSGPAAALQGATRFADCKLGAADGPGRELHVELPAGSELSVGQPLRLARSRYDGVFPVPRTAIVRVGDTDRVYVAGAGGITEARAVTLADAGGDEALVSQGIDVGDQVIADPPGDLHDGESIRIEK